ERLKRLLADEAAGITRRILQERGIRFLDDVGAQHAHPSIAAQPLEEREPHCIAHAVVDDLPAYLARQLFDAVHGLDGARYGRTVPNGPCPAPATAGGAISKLRCPACGGRGSRRARSRAR